MRRIYESEGVERDDGPFTPARRSADRPQAARSVNAAAVSRLLAPAWLRHRAVSVEVSTPRSTYAVGESVPFTVTMKNALPFPIAIRTRSPVPWTWDVDGEVEASRVPRRGPPDERGELAFGRGERKRFRKRWRGTFRVSDREWVSADPGEYTIGVEINVRRPTARGLRDETSIRLRSE